jgi:C4-dicarboxylate transporter DctM subunit
VPSRIITAANIEVGMCHPAVGSNLRIASGITKTGTALTVAMWPWLVSMLVFLVLVTHRPATSLALGMM